MFSHKTRSTVLFAATAAVLPFLAVSSASAGPDDKVTICHATASASNPYVKITVAEDAVDGVAGNSGNQADHFGEHQGALFDAAVHGSGDNWGDIIPPVPPHHGGLNWSDAGQSIYNNGCNVPDNPPDEQIETPEATFEDPCGPNNASWNEPVDTALLGWSVSNGHLVVEILGTDVTFPGGKTSHDFGVAPETNTASCGGEIGSAGHPEASPACKAVIIHQPTYSPADATVQILLDGTPVSVGKHSAAVGDHTVELLVNGESVGALVVKAKQCGGHNPTSDPDLENPTFAHTGH